MSKVVLPGDDLYSVFTWLVVPVVVTVTGTETAVVFPFWYWLGCIICKIT